MAWQVLLENSFAKELDELNQAVKLELLAQANLLEAFGPSLGRPRVDTLNGSLHRNMKELRFSVEGGEWRVAFAFDPQRQAILLVVGDKSGVAQAAFYRKLIAKADKRFGEHLKLLKKG
jgi:hypothetical protein